MREIDHEPHSGCVCVQSAALMFCNLYAVLLYGESAHHASTISPIQALRGETAFHTTPRPHMGSTSTPSVRAPPYVHEA